MAGFVEGINREQSTLFPARLDDYIAEDNPVRAIDALGVRRTAARTWGGRPRHILFFRQ